MLRKPNTLNCDFVQDSGRKGKTKYVNLSEGPSGSTQVPGRHACECQARKHDLVSNCVSCGRIVCAQEGSGPCLFCGSLVVTRDEQEVRILGYAFRVVVQTIFDVALTLLFLEYCWSRW